MNLMRKYNLKINRKIFFLSEYLNLCIALNFIHPMKKRIILFLLPTLLVICLAKANDSTKYSFLPEGHLFKPLLLDPLQAQLYSSFCKRWENYRDVQGQYIPFAVGLNPSLLRWSGKVKKYEIALAACAFAQFEWKTTSNGVWQRNLLNSDYLVGSMLNVQHNEQNTTRFRFYHISSHNGDDYMIRNGIKSYSPNPQNYEQIDITHSYSTKNWRWYGSAGTNISIDTLRKRLCFELGFEFRWPLKKSTSLFLGTDAKMFQQNGFTPGFKNAIGIAFNNNAEKNMYLLLEYYQGHLPYSQYENRRYEWIGLGWYFSL